PDLYFHWCKRYGEGRDAGGGGCAGGEDAARVVAYGSLAARGEVAVGDLEFLSGLVQGVVDEHSAGEPLRGGGVGDDDDLVIGEDAREGDDDAGARPQADD